MIFVGFLVTEWQVTSKWIVRSCRNSNLSEILCLSRLSATFIKSQSKQAMLRTRSNMGVFGTKGQVIPKSIVRSGQNSNLSENLQCTPVQIVCKFHNLSVWTKQATLRTMSNMGFFVTEGQVNPKSMVWSGRNSNYFEIVCLFRLSAGFIQIRLKTKQAMLRTRLVFFGTHGQVTPKWRVRSGRDASFEDGSIKSEGAILRTTLLPL